MAMSGRVGRRRSRARPMPMSRINVTPFVDVMLVLLIVFMIAAPLLSIGIPIELPKSDDSVSLPADQQILTVSVTKEGRVFLQDTEVDIDELRQQLQARHQAQNNNDVGSIYVRGDSQAQYGVMAEIIAIVKASGFRRVGFITETKSSQP